MKYILAGLGGLVGVVLAALMIVPAVIDWNQYRSDIAARASHALGRTVEIRGDIGLTLFPAPIVTIKDAHLANVEGASDVDMISLASLQVKVAWAPLLAGNIRVESVKLVHPVFNLELFEDGQSNLSFQPPASEEPAPAPSAALRIPGNGPVSPKTGNRFDISVDNFVVEKGTLVFRNVARGIEEHVDDLNGRFALASLKGPMDAVATAVVHGVPLALDISTNEVIQGRTMPFNLDLAVVSGNAKIQVSGSLNGIDETPRFKGKMTVEGDNLHAFARALGVATVPEFLRRTFGAQANVSVAADGVELADLTLKLDGAQAIGRLTADLTGKPAIEANLAISRLDLDALMRAPAAAPVSVKSVSPPVAKRAPSTTALDLPTEARPSSVAPDKGFSLEDLPADLSANFALTIDATTWRSEVTRQAKLDLSLANREITVSQLSALLPGGSDVALFGFVTEKDGLPQFDGTVDATTNDLRALAEWLGASTKGVAADRLRKLSFNAKLSARPDLATVSELHAQLDATQIDGALTAGWTSRLSLGANLAVDRVNLDAYRLASDGASAPLSSDTPPQTPSAASSAKGTPAAGSANPLAMLAMLNGFDANLRLRVGTATAAGLPFNDVRIEAALVDGTLDVKSASIGDLVGTTASLSGAVSDFAPTLMMRTADPKFKDVVFNAAGRNLANLFRLAEVKSPVSAENLGAVAFTSRLNGSLHALDFASELQAMGGKSSVTGHLDTRELLPRLEASVALSHPDFARFVRGFGTDYRPRSAKGGIDLQGKIVGSLFEFGLDDLAGSIAGVRLHGTGASRMPWLGGRKPQLALKLATGDLDLDSFLPQKRTAAIETRSFVQPASFRVPVGVAAKENFIRVATKSAEIWSSAPLDLSVLASFDGSFAVKSDSLSYGKVVVANADLDTELQNGVLEIRHLTGKTFGGDLTIDGGLAAEAQGGRFEVRYALSGADVGAADRALDTKSTAKGNATFDGKLSGRGKSEAEIVASLGGEGTLAFKGVNVASGEGLAMMGLGGVAQAMERVAGLRGRLQPYPVNLSGLYRIANGVVTFDDLAFTSEVGEGALKGKADLSKWQMAASGEIRLAKEFVIGDAKTAKPIPFTLDGALDAPRLKIDIAALPGGGVRIPLGKNIKEGAKELLNGLVPRSAQKREAPTVESLPPPAAVTATPAAPTPPPAVAAPPPAEPKKGERVEDILKGILKGISR